MINDSAGQHFDSSVPVVNYKCACFFEWVWNLVADIAGGKEVEGVWQHGVEENIWTYEGWGNGGMEETA